MKTIFNSFFAAAIIVLAAFSNATASPGNANVQVIHNCADPQADSVDVYVDGTKAIPNFKFRTATPFIQLSAGITHVIGIAPPNSDSVQQSIAFFSEGPLSADSNYIIIAEGVVDTVGFAANPSGVSIAFNLKVIASAEQTASNPANVDFAIYHGATDAPAVDVKLSGPGPVLASDAIYTDATGYLSVKPTWYPIDVLPHGSNTPVASYLADLSGLAGGAGVVLASGFLTPSSNHNGPSFGLYLALASGGNLIQLPLQTFANVQVIHNAPDPGADSVDVYIDGNKAISNFKFRTATPFIPVLAGVNHTIAVAPPNSDSVQQALATFPNINLTAGINYVVTASGVLNPANFAVNPSGRSTAFTLLVKDSAETQAAKSGDFDFFAIHGSPDAPGVNVAAVGVATLITNAKYTDQTGYFPVPAASYILDVQDSAGTSLVEYSANLSGLADSSGVVLASGFLTPSSNQNGPAFGLYVALPGGGPLIPLPVYTGINEIKNETGLSVYPNPNNGLLSVKFDVNQADKVSVDIMDVNGSVVKQLANGSLSGSQSINADISDLSNGVYFVRIAGSNSVSNQKFVLVK